MLRVGMFFTMFKPLKLIVSLIVSYFLLRRALSKWAEDLCLLSKSLI
ncbi:hypothetical protein SAMN05519226_2279 [Cycloclasticus pugetii]|nr:hypothetical protein SAMN05519226_2279 [Cycloclasticus pugetii]